MNFAAYLLFEMAKREPKENVLIYSEYRRKLDGLNLEPLECEDACRELAEILRV